MKSFLNTYSLKLPLMLAGNQKRTSEINELDADFSFDTAQKWNESVK